MLATLAADSSQKKQQMPPGSTAFMAAELDACSLQEENS
jgi:hypothetical protein